MLAEFCLRLSFGLLASLLLLLSYQINPRFYRVHFFTALGLVTGAGIILFDPADVWMSLTLATTILVCALGSMSWSLDKAPGGRGLIVFASILSGVTLALHSLSHYGYDPLLLANDFTAAAVLGTVLTAMLLGHSYLIAPTMSIKPLLRLLLALGTSLLVRTAVALYGLWLWTESASASNLETEVVLWLIVRWGLGVAAPLILAWMAWETARIRSTQSATGILYVVVIVCFLGELTSQLLVHKTGFAL